jgi:hypothetical protein
MDSELWRFIAGLDASELAAFDTRPEDEELSRKSEDTDSASPSNTDSDEEWVPGCRRKKRRPREDDAEIESDAEVDDDNPSSRVVKCRCCGSAGRYERSCGTGSHVCLRGVCSSGNEPPLELYRCCYCNREKWAKSQAPTKRSTKRSRKSKRPKQAGQQPPKRRCECRGLSRDGKTLNMHSMWVKVERR